MGAITNFFCIKSPYLRSSRENDWKKEKVMGSFSTQWAESYLPERHRHKQPAKKHLEFFCHAAEINTGQLAFLFLDTAAGIGSQTWWPDTAGWAGPEASSLTR